MTHKKVKISFVTLIVLLLIACVSSLCIGAIHIPMTSLISIFGSKIGLHTSYTHTFQEEAVLTSLRMPRMLLGVLVGATLSISGAAIQGLFRNPLAEPGIIGISAGATFFAVLFIVLEASVFHILIENFGYYALSIAAFFGALITTVIIYRFSVRNGRTDITSLLLIGIAINALVMSFTGLLTYIARDDQLRNITFWSLGSLGGANWKSVITIFPFSLISIIGLLLFPKALNAIALGEAQAEHLGINMQKTKLYIILLAAVGVGASVALTGLIGFISLVTPHILRMSVSGDHKYLLLSSALFGGSVLVGADLIARTIVAPSELPLGILTAIIGVPIFLYMIIKDRKSRGNI